MTFCAKGKLVKIQTDRQGRIRKIFAEMHEGFLGINHPVFIQIDKKFGEDVAKQLQFRKGERTTTYIGSVMDEMRDMNPSLDSVGSQNVVNAKIEIVIK